MKDAPKKNALVVGATGALGAALVTALVQEGYDVYGTTRKPEETGERMFLLDLMNKAHVTALATKLPKLSFLTCTIANPPRIGRFEKFPIEEFRRDWDVNVEGQIVLLQTMLPLLEEGACVILVASEVTVDDLLAYTAPYTVSKYALVGLAHALAVELAGRKIQVNAVSPGMMQTPFLEHVPSLLRQNYLHTSRRAAFLTPEEVARRIVESSQKGETGKNYPIL